MTNNSNTQSLLELLFTLDQVSKRFNMPKSTLRKYVHLGLLERVPQIERPWYFTEEQLQDFKKKLLEKKDEKL